MLQKFVKQVEFYLGVGLFILTVLVFFDAIKSTVNYYMPNKDNKIIVKYVMGVVLIVISFIAVGLSSSLDGIMQRM